MEPNAAVRLEPLHLDHLPLVMTWVNDREVMQYFANRQVAISADEERGYLERLIASPNDRAYSIFSGDEYLGQCSVNQIYWPAKNGRLFIALRQQAQHRGFATLALRTLFTKAFGELSLHKLWLIVRSDNRTSQALYLNLGFDFEGVLADEYYVNGRYYDMVRMGLLAPVSTAST
jgi:RimJ/RimL family protein N-acetyltransferase